MDVADFGAFPGDVLAFGGVASNAHALTALVAEAIRRGLTGRDAVCTGDAVAYCAEPGEALEGLSRFGVHAIAGNCEIALVEARGDCGCGFAQGSVCEIAARSWFAHARVRVGPGHLAWCAALPRLAVFEAHGRRWGVLHGGARETSRFVWPSSPEAVFAEEIDAFEALAGPVDGIVAGHCGLPFIRETGGRIWLNPGSVGMPAHDGSPRTSFAVIGAAGPELQRLRYDHAGAAALMRRAGLVQGYEETLETGWWPSEDILPRAHRRASGHLDDA